MAVRVEVSRLARLAEPPDRAGDAARHHSFDAPEVSRGESPQATGGSAPLPAIPPRYATVGFAKPGQWP
jgi:hypothetical protein